MLIIRNKVKLEDVKKIAEETFGDMVKVVVDVDRDIMAIGGELHADEEKLLIEDGSKQEYLWGVNLYPEIKGEDWIEFDSMINLRPSQGNRTRGVDSFELREKIIEIMNQIISR